MEDPYRDSPFINELHAKDAIILMQTEQLYCRGQRLKQVDSLYRAEVIENNRLRNKIARDQHMRRNAKIVGATVSCVMALSYGFDSITWDVRAVDSESMGGSSGYTQPMFVNSATSSYMYDIEIDFVEVEREDSAICVDPFVPPRPARDPLKGHLANNRNGNLEFPYPTRPIKLALASQPMPTATTMPHPWLVEHAIPSCPP